jgi:predicted SAM-dependent methyltransferase
VKLSREDARRALVAYLDHLERDPGFDARPRPGDPLVRRLGKQLVPQRYRLAARVLATQARARRARRRAAELAGRSPLRLHLASGPVAKPDWVDVDLAGDAVDLEWNITTGLPFRDSSVDAIFHEHFLEHLGLADGYALMLESHRVLRPSGVLRIGVPDGERPQSSWPDAPTKLLALQEFFRDPGHVTLYDVETLTLLLTAAGFEGIARRPFGDSRLDPCPDSEHRRAETLYVEAIKPLAQPDTSSDSADRLKP